MQLEHRLAAHLEGGRHLTRVLRHRAGEQPEGAHLLDSREPFIGASDFLLDELAHLGPQREVRVRGEGKLAAQRPVRHRLRVHLHQRGDEGSTVANGHRLLDVRTVLQRVLDALGRQVLSAGGDEDFALAAGDAQVAVRVDLAQVPRVQPALRVTDLGGGLRLVEVAEEHVGPTHEHLTVLREPTLHAGHGAPDGAQLRGARDVEVAGARALRLAVALVDADADAVVPGEQLRGDGRRAGDGEATAPQAQALLERPVDEQVPDTPRERVPPAALPRALPLANLRAQPREGVEEGALEPRGVTHLHRYRRVHLLPDARHAQEHGGGDLGHVALHRLQRLAEVDLPADDERQQQAEQLLRDVTQRQVRDDAVVLAQPELRGEGRRALQHVSAGDERALRCPRGPRRVDDHGRFIGRAPRELLAEPARLTLQQRASFLQEALPRAQPGVLHAAQAAWLDDEHVLDGGCLGGDGGDLVVLLLVLAEHDAAPGVVEDVRDVRGRIRLVDADGARAERLGAQVREQPLRPVVTEDGHRVPGAHAQLPQHPRRLADALQVALERQLVPDAQALLADGHRVGVLLRAQEELTRQAQGKRRVHAATVPPT